MIANRMSPLCSRIARRRRPAVPDSEHARTFRTASIDAGKMTLGVNHVILGDQAPCPFFLR